MRTLVALAFALCAISPALAEPVEGDGHRFTISDQDLIVEWAKADELCRGSYPDDIKGYIGCAQRDALSTVIEERGYCHPKPTVLGGFERCTRL